MLNGSMAAMWLSGFEENFKDAGELWIVETFGRTIEKAGTAEIGVGAKKLLDPRLEQDFVAPHLSLNVAEFHEFAVDRRDSHSTFHVDGEVVHASPQAPAYPMQAMVAVFDFPECAEPGANTHVPELIVDWIRGE